LPTENIDKLLSFIGHLEDAENICDLIPLMINHNQVETEDAEVINIFSDVSLTIPF
jgi:hypothetical protein